MNFDGLEQRVTHISEYLTILEETPEFFKQISALRLNSAFRMYHEFVSTVKQHGYLDADSNLLDKYRMQDIPEVMLEEYKQLEVFCEELFNSKVVAPDIELATFH